MKGCLTDVPGIRVGQVTDEAGLTGCTVVLCPPEGAAAGADVRGAAPGTRETDLLRAGHLVERVHAVVLTGGSAFGLDAASGVMKFLDERDIGFDTGVARIPIVPAAVLFDLNVGDARARPGPEMGYQACLTATADGVEEGNVGAGTGATVGKMFGPQFAMKGGVGTASLRLDSGVTVGALVVVNSFGDVWDPVEGRKIAGARNPLTGKMVDTLQMFTRGENAGDLAGFNTTLAVVATDARLDRNGANRVATMAHNGLARTIMPVHTMYDGDAVFALSTGDRPAPATVVGTVAVHVLARAVVRALRAARSVAGVPASGDVEWEGGAPTAPDA